MHSIRHRLEDMGWKDVLNNISDEDTSAFKQLPEVRQPKVLTDRGNGF